MRNKSWRKAVAIAVALAMCNGPLDLVAEAKEAVSAPLREEQALREELASMGEAGSPGTIAFYDTGDITVSEGDGSFEIRVVRMGSTEGEASVQFKAVDVNAHYGEDYIVTLKESFGREQTVSANDAALSIMDQMVDEANGAGAGEADSNGAEAGGAISNGADSNGDAVSANDAADMDEHGRSSISGSDHQGLQGGGDISSSDRITDTITVSEETAAAKETDGTATGASEPGAAAVSSLREAKSAQTGKVSDQPDWRGQYEQDRLLHQLEKDAADEAANQLVNKIEGHSMLLNFADGEYCKVLEVTVIDDDIAEGKEAAVFLLGETANALLGDGMQRKLILEDNDGQEEITYAMKEATVYADRADGKAVLTISRTSGIGKYSSVYVSTASDTARANVDYTSCNSQVVTFKAGESEYQLEIPLQEGGVGDHFYVMLDTDDMNVEEGRDVTEVYIRDTIRETIPVEAGQSTEQAGMYAASRAGRESSYTKFHNGSYGYLYRNWSEEYKGNIKYDVATITGDSGWFLAQARGTGGWSWRTWSNSGWFNLKNVDYISVDYDIEGRYKTGLIWYYDKYGAVGFGGNNNVFTHTVSDKKSNRSVNYKEGAYLNSSQRNSSNYAVRVYAESNWWNEVCDLKMNSIKLYYPQYSLTFSEGNHTTKTKIYTAKNTSVEGSSVTLGAYNGKKGVLSNNSGSIYIVPASIHKDAYIKRYKVFIGGLEVGTLSGSQTWLGYNEIFQLQQQNAYRLIGKNTTNVKIEPVYEFYPAKVLLQSQNTTLIDYSEAKAGDVINCRRLDSVKVTGAGKKGFQTSDIKLVSYAADSSDDAKNLKDDLLKNKYAKKSTSPVSCSLTGSTATAVNLKSYNYITVYHKEPTLTVRYDPDETLEYGSANYGKWYQMATCGMISVYKGSDNGVEEALGVSDLLTPVTKKSGITLSNPIRTEFIRGEEALKPVPDPDHPTNKYFAKWRYAQPVLNSSGQMLLNNDGTVVTAETTVTGDGFQLTPYQADTILNYYFTFDTMNLIKPRVSGTITIREVPLFSKTNTKVDKKAAGVEVNIAGKSVTTNTDGAYSIECEVPKGNAMSGYLKYGTLMSYMTLPANTRDHQDYRLSANDSDGISVTSSSIFKDVKYTSGGILAGVGAVVTQIKNEEVEAVSLDDTNYTFKLQTRGEGDIVPTQAVFRFLSKSGAVRTTQTVEVDSEQRDYFEWTMNPRTLKLEAGDVLTVQFYDKKGKAYYQHQTEVMVYKVYEQGLCMWNYQNTQSADDSLLDSIVGNMSIGYDFVLDAMSSSYGIHQEKITDADGNEVNEKHQIYGFGFGKGSSIDKGYETAKATVQQIKDAGTKDVTLYQDDSFNLFSSDADTGSSGWGIGIQIGVYLDLVAGDGTGGTEKGEWYFNDFLLVGQVDVGYSYEKMIKISCVSIYLTLEFYMQDTGIEWHWENDGEERVKLSNGEGDGSSTDKSVLNLVGSDKTYGEGKLQIKGQVMGSANLGFGSSSAAFIGLGGSLNVAPTMVFAYNRGAGEVSNSWKNYGQVVLTPSFYIKASVIKIPLWTQRFVWDWGTGRNGRMQLAAMDSVMEEMMWEEDILRTSTSKSETADRSYLADRSGWNGTAPAAGAFRSAPVTERLQETILMSGLYPNSDMAVENIGGGSYLAVFTDDDADRDEYNRVALYYSIYNGSTWSNPVKLEDDGLSDEVPVICSAGSKGYLIAWSAAGSAASKGQDVGELLNTYDIHGVFYDPLKNEMGPVQKITRTTARDLAGDSRPQISYYQGDETTPETLMICYTKSEYSVSDRTEGEVVGDVLNPYSILVSRFYDFDKDQWKDTYSEEDKAEIMGNRNMSEEEFAQYEEDFYGQLFLDLAPAVTVEETLDTDGYWAGDVAITNYTGQADPMVTDAANIAYNHLSLMAYVLDNDGNRDTTDDRNIYLQIYNMQDQEFHHPAMLTSEQADCSNLQLVRVGDTTYLYWLQDGEIRQMDLSVIVKERLLERESAGRKYYIVDKTSPELEADDKAAYAPPVVIVKAPETEIEGADEEGEELLTGTGGDQEGLNTAHINEFTVKKEDGSVYLLWAETGTTGEEEEKKANTRLMVSRGENVRYERTEEGATEAAYALKLSNPVVLAEKEGCNYLGTDFAVTDQGGILALSRVADTDEDNQPDESTSRLVAIAYQPVKSAVIGEPEYGEPFRTESLYQPVELSVVNNDVLDIENGRAVWTDAGGKVMADKTQEFKLSGGRSIRLCGEALMDENGSYDVTLTVYDGDVVLDEKTISGNAEVSMSTEAFTVNTLGRDSLAVRAEFRNTSIFNTGSKNMALGYLDEEGNKKLVHTFRIPSIEPGETWTLAESVEVDYDALFPEDRKEDGTIESVREFYLEAEAAVMVTQYAEAGLKATAAQIALMDSVPELTMDPVTLKQDEIVDVPLRSAGNEVSRETMDAGLKMVWVLPDEETAVLTEDGRIVGRKEGTVEVTGYIMPFDSEFQAQEGCEVLAVDNFSTLPASMIRKVTAAITVTAQQEEPAPDPDDGSGEDDNHGGNPGQDQNASDNAQGTGKIDKKSPATGDLTRESNTGKPTAAGTTEGLGAVRTWICLWAVIAILSAMAAAVVWYRRKRSDKD